MQHRELGRIPLHRIAPLRQPDVPARRRADRRKETKDKGVELIVGGPVRLLHCGIPLVNGKILNLYARPPPAERGLRPVAERVRNVLGIVVRVGAGLGGSVPRLGLWSQGLRRRCVRRSTVPPR